MLEGINQLLELQESDKKIADVKQSLAKFSQEYAGLKNALKSKEDTLKKLKGENEDFGKEKKDIELEIKVETGEAQKYRTQLQNVKTNKEYQAFLHEIEHIEAKIEEHETRILKIMEREDSYKKELTIRLKNFEGEKAKCDTELKRLKSLEEEKEKELAGLEYDRKKVADTTISEFLEQYDRISKRHPASAVARVEDGTCGGCHMALVDQRIINIRKAEKIIRCESCTRIMYCE